MRLPLLLRASGTLLAGIPSRLGADASLPASLSRPLTSSLLPPRTADSLLPHKSALANSRLTPALHLAIPGPHPAVAAPESQQGLLSRSTLGSPVRAGHSGQAAPGFPAGSWPWTASVHQQCSSSQAFAGVRPQVLLSAGAVASRHHSAGSPAMAPVGSSEEVVGVRQGHAAFAVLNRPKALNSFNDNMVSILRGLYDQWEQDPNVNVIVLKSDGRAFCAGGDVRACYNLGKEGRWVEAAEFFRKEYELNYMIATLGRPHVSLINGVVMGGGNGVSIHGTFRVVTEKALFAMPETLIGLHPDIGASYFLPRLPGYLGEYLGLTGARLKATDMLACGLATHMVPSERLAMLEERLTAMRVPDVESINMAINEHAEAGHVDELEVMKQMPLINETFRHPTVEGIFGALEQGAQGDVAADAQWCADTLATLKRMSPTSLKVSLRSMREGRGQTLADRLKVDLRLSYRCMDQKVSTDFYEGVRALLVDKDNSPKFSPPVVEEVTEEMVDAYFRPFEDPARELKLAVRERRFALSHL